MKKSSISLEEIRLGLNLSERDQREGSTEINATSLWLVWVNSWWSKFTYHIHQISLMFYIKKVTKMEMRLKKMEWNTEMYLCYAEFGIWGKNLKLVGGAELSNIREYRMPYFYGAFWLWNSLLSPKELCGGKVTFRVRQCISSSFKKETTL